MPGTRVKGAAIAEQSGIDPSALHRAEQGDNMRLSTAIAIVQWLGEG